MHAQKTFSLFISIEKTEKLTKREIEQAEAKVILFFAKFSAKCFQNWPIKNSLRIFFSSTFKSRQADNIKVYFGKVNLESAKSRWLNTGQVLCLYGPQLRLGPLKKNGQYSATSVKQVWSVKGLLCGVNKTIFSQKTAGHLKRAR